MTSAIGLMAVVAVVCLVFGLVAAIGDWWTNRNPPTNASRFLGNKARGNPEPQTRDFYINKALACCHASQSAGKVMRSKP